MIDMQTLLSNKQAITVSAVSTHIYDLGNDDALVPAINQKQAMMFILITTRFTGGTSIYVTMQTSDSSDFSDYITVLSTESLTADGLQQGREFRADNLPSGLRQYIRFYYVVVGTFITGNISAGLVIDKQSMPSHLFTTLHLITEDGRHITTEDGRTIRIG